MSQQHKVWIDQCDATPNILNNFGVQPALHYLVGEKFLDFLETSEKDDDFEGELPAFAEGVKELFDQATEFATTIGEGNVQSISHSQDGMSGIVVVWYWE